MYKRKCVFPLKKAKDDENQEDVIELAKVQMTRMLKRVDLNDDAFDIDIDATSKFLILKWSDDNVERFVAAYCSTFQRGYPTKRKRGEIASGYEKIDGEWIPGYPRLKEEDFPDLRFDLFSGSNPTDV